ncbi:MAG TPA: putative zinc-binding protein [Verrucomicrobiae bacterium]|nr:putative zinc-binding protein [Verrucomicrobiae bacterium]
MTTRHDSCESKLVFACSGGSDVGQLADLGARAAARPGGGKMYCLAGIGGRVEPILATARAAAKILAIDGCPQACARKTLEQAGFTGFRHLPLHQLGFAKGRSEVTPERVQLVARRAMELLA